MYRRFFKRFFDIILSFLGIIILAIPMLIIAIIVKCDSKGPAIFKTERVGRNCKPFKFYKFRSMTTDAPKDCATRLLDSNAYITKVGRFLRKTSLDELPQLFCIFVGSMSIIGPRPTGFSEQDLIDARKKNNSFSVRPGLTGLAQVNGRDVLAENVEMKAWYDGEYVKKITFWGDLKIFFKTIGIVFKQDGVKEGTAKKNETENETSAVQTAESELAVSAAQNYAVAEESAEIIENDGEGYGVVAVGTEIVEGQFESEAESTAKTA